MNEAYKIKTETLSNTVKKLNSEISNLKRQLKIQIKLHKDMENAIASQREMSDHYG